MEIVKPGGTVLDPFLGGGTTAHAAMLTGRKCIWNFPRTM
ncbi:DNA methyltransferase [Bilophila sp. 4_1_30]